jgi:hypothetical protein
MSGPAFRRAFFLLGSFLLLSGQAPRPPEISAIEPTSGIVGTNIRLTGRQFTSDNTVYFGSTIIRHVAVSSAIGIACTTNPNCQPGIVQTIRFSVPAMATRGPNDVSLQNSNGTSNAVKFTVLARP